MIRRFALVAVALVAWTVLATGQQPPAQTPPPQTAPPPQTPPAQQVPPPPIFKTKAEIIRLDVSVLDSTRLPVRGLEMKDFTVLDAGKVQPLTTFAEVIVPDPVVPTTAWMRDVAPDIKRNDDMNDRRLILIVLDDAQVDSMDPRRAVNVKAAGHAIIDQMGEGDLAAVIYTLDSRNMQEFTTDRTRLLAAIDRFKGGLNGDVELFQRYSVDTLQRAADILLEIPQRRKALFYVSTGVNVNLNDIAPVSATIHADTHNDRAGATSQLIHDMQEVFRKAQLGNVNIHSVDPSNLDRASGGFGLADPRKDFLISLSRETGGFPIIQTEDFHQAIAQVFLENSSYYLLGYEPTAPDDGRFHKTEVRVDRPGLTVRARTGYYAPDAIKAVSSSDTHKAGPSPLWSAISGLMPLGDLPLQVTAAPFAIPQKKESTVAIVLGIVQDADTGTERKVEHIDFLVDAFGQDGSSKSFHGLKADVTLKANVKGKIGYEVLTRVDLKPGRYQLRLSANLPSTNTSGSIYYDVDVPDFSKAQLALSGAVLSVTPALVAAPRDKLADLMPIVPTTNRYFNPKTDAVSSFVRVYQHGKGDVKPVTMVSRITDSKGIAVVNRVVTLPAAVFGNADRTAPFRFAVPITGLPPGHYLLTFEASVGTVTSKRDIRFNVQ